MRAVRARGTQGVGRGMRSLRGLARRRPTGLEWRARGKDALACVGLKVLSRRTKFERAAPLRSLAFRGNFVCFFGPLSATNITGPTLLFSRKDSPLPSDRHIRDHPNGLRHKSPPKPLFCGGPSSATSQVQSNHSVWTECQPCVANGHSAVRLARSPLQLVLAPPLGLHSTQIEHRLRHIEHRLLWFPQRYAEQRQVLGTEHLSQARVRLWG